MEAANTDAVVGGSAADDFGRDTLLLTAATYAYASGGYAISNGSTPQGGATNLPETEQPFQPRLQIFLPRLNR